MKDEVDTLVAFNNINYIQEDNKKIKINENFSSNISELKNIFFGKKLSNKFENNKVVSQNLINNKDVFDKNKLSDEVNELYFNKRNNSNIFDNNQIKFKVDNVTDSSVKKNKIKSLFSSY